MEETIVEEPVVEPMSDEKTLKKNLHQSVSTEPSWKPSWMNKQDDIKVFSRDNFEQECRLMDSRRYRSGFCLLFLLPFAFQVSFRENTTIERNR